MLDRPLQDHTGSVIPQLLTAGDGWDVGSIACHDSFDDVSRLREVIVVGDDEYVVRLAASGHADVQAAAGRRAGRQGDAAILGGGLVAGFGASGIPEMLPTVFPIRRNRQGCSRQMFPIQFPLTVRDSMGRPVPRPGRVGLPLSGRL